MKKLDLAEAEKELDKLRQRICDLNIKAPDCLHTEQLGSIDGKMDELLAAVFPKSSQQERS